MIPGTPALAGNKDTLSILPIKLLDTNIIRLLEKDDGVFKIDFFVFSASCFAFFSDVSANSFVFDWSTSFWIDFLMTSERLLFETPLSRNRRF